MQVELHPLDPIAKKRINDLLVSDIFQRWVQTIQDEVEFEVHTAKVDLVPLLTDQRIASIDPSPFMRAARLQNAIAVIEEFAKTEKEHSTLKIV